MVLTVLACTCLPPLIQIDMWKLTQALNSFKQRAPASLPEQQQATGAVPATCVPMEPLLPLPFGPEGQGSSRFEWMYDVWGYPYIPN
jgi:hypothetical protein